MSKPFALAALLIALSGTVSWGQSAKSSPPSAPVKADPAKGGAAQQPADKSKPATAKLSADIDRGSPGSSGESPAPIVEGTKSIPTKEESGGDPKPKS